MTATAEPAARAAILRPLAFTLTLLTGFTALVYEVAWQKYLAILLGSHSEATAAVLGIFLGGLAAGYALFGALTRRLVARAAAAGTRPRLLRWYGALEVAIGLYALLFPLLFLAMRALSVSVPHPADGLGFVFDVILSALLIGPPTVLMGGTIPFLTQALARDMRDSTRTHAFVYAFNTAGAFAGALAAGFVLVPGLGLVGVMLAMALLNIAAGVTFVRLDGVAPLRPPASQGFASTHPPLHGFAAYAAVALLTGFAMMTVQTAVIRIGHQAFGSSELTFSMVVAVFVLCIALGSFAVSALRRIPRWLVLANQWLLAVSLIWLYLKLPDGPYLVHRLRILFTTEPAAFYLFQVAAFFGVLALLAGPVLLSGAALPLLFDRLRQDLGDLGAVAGKLYSWNTVGSLLGALLGGYALLYWLDLHLVFRIAIAAVAASALLLGVVLGGVRARAATAAAAVLVGIWMLTLQPWSPARISPGLFRAWTALAYSDRPPAEFFEAWWAGTRLPFYADDPSVSVLVTEGERPEVGIVRSVLVNGKSDSSTFGDNATTGLLAMLPALFAEQANNAFVIGYGTGVTVGELAQLDSMQEVVVAEISSAVIEAAPLFDFANHNASTNEKVRIVRSDAYRALLRSAQQYDLIVSEPSNPWVIGVEMLYSREFLQAARKKLAPGGVFAQWFHQYSTNRDAVELVLRSYAAAFDHVSVWYGRGQDLLLLGFDQPEHATDLVRLEARAALPDFAAGLRRSEVDSLPALLAHEVLPLGVLHALALEGPLQTLLRPRLHDITARAYFRGQVAELPFSGSREAAQIGARNSLLRRYLGSVAGDGESRRLATLESCRHNSRQCTALLAHWFALVGRATPQFQSTLRSAAQASDQAFGGRLDQRNIAALATALFSEAPLPVQVPAAEARRAQQLLQAFFHHAIPMQSQRVLQMWERCAAAADRPELCAEGLNGARELLGVASDPAPP